MCLYKRNKRIKICLIIAIASIMMVSLCGFQDFKKEGVKCKFRAIILNIERHPDGYHILVVEKTPAANLKEKRIYIIVTEKTILGPPMRPLALGDLKVGSSIFIKGLKVIEKEDEKEFIVVEADHINLGGG